YKVFSNIPFNLTSEIIHKLTEVLNPPGDIYLIVQKEAALKFLDKTLASLLLKPDFNLEIIHKFNRKDFQPTPRVDSVMLRMIKRKVPLITEADKSHYRDFVVYAFDKWRLVSKNLGFKKLTSPTLLSFDRWLEIFKKKNLKESLFLGSYKNWLKQQQKLKKIHRTRLDVDWKQK
ncbi:hypothetical protein HY085_01690, partial [Candidatus Gottesmanbacteria bacterium]|nr:hypothetical protein [Candidatus Gottesmanbacteria bacterium]